MSSFVLKIEQYLLSSFCENFYNSSKQKGENRQTQNNTDLEQSKYQAFFYAKQCFNSSKAVLSAIQLRP